MNRKLDKLARQTWKTFAACYAGGYKQGVEEMREACIVKLREVELNELERGAFMLFQEAQKNAIRELKLSHVLDISKRGEEPRDVP